MHTELALLTRRSFLGAAAFAGASALHAAPDDRWKIGCYTRPWDQFDYRTALDGIAEAGFRYAGLMTHKGKPSTVINATTTLEEAAAIGGEVRKRGIETISIYGGNFPYQKSIADGVAGLRRLIDNCAACRCPGLLLGGASKPELTTAYYQVVKECCDYAASKKVGLSVKPHGGTNATGAECRKIIEMVGHKNFGIWYDPGNIFYYSDGALDPVDDAPSVNGLVVGMSVKDFKPPKEVLVTPGAGKVNFREVLARLKKGGFRSGPLVVECLDRHDSAAQITAEARKARQFLLALTAS
jgi:sugar phosphate isomerase/epimerase